MPSLALLLPSLLACTDGGGGGGDSDYALSVTPVLARDQGGLLEDLDSMDLVITQSDGTETVLALSSLAEGDSSTFEELPPLEGATLELRGYTGNDLAAIGSTEPLDLATGTDEVSILVAAVDDVADFQDLSSPRAFGAMAGDGSGGFYIFGGNAEGVYPDDASDEVWFIDVAPPSDSLLFSKIEGLTVPPLDNGDTGRICHSATRLTQGGHDRVGRILVAGGAGNFMADNDGGFTPQLDTVTWSSFLFDPDAGTITELAESQALVQPRCAHTATELPSGDVVVAGGLAVGGAGAFSNQDTAEIYNPVAGGFERVDGEPSGPLLLHGAAALGDQGVLVCGGLEDAGSGFRASDACDLITTSGSFVAAPSLPEPLIHPAMASLPGDRVLLTGGMAPGDGTYTLFDFPADVSDQVYVFDGTEWSTPGEGDAVRLAVPRALHEMVELPGGDVLIVGGTSSVERFWNAVWGSSAAVPCVELYSAELDRIGVVSGTCDADSGLGPMPEPAARPMVAVDEQFGALIAGGLSPDEEAAAGVGLYVPAGQ